MDDHHEGAEWKPLTPFVRNSSGRRGRRADTWSGCPTTGWSGVLTRSRSPPASWPRTSSSASGGLTRSSVAYRSYRASSSAELIETFDADVAKGAALLAAVDDTVLKSPWRLTVKGKVRFERPRDEVFRDFTLSHLIHHRGQLSVYLRLLDLPVPGAYGPTADE